MAWQASAENLKQLSDNRPKTNSLCRFVCSYTEPQIETEPTALRRNPSYNPQGATPLQTSSQTFIMYVWQWNHKARCLSPSMQSQIGVSEKGLYPRNGKSSCCSSSAGSDNLPALRKQNREVLMLKQLSGFRYSSPRGLRIP